MKNPFVLLVLAVGLAGCASIQTYDPVVAVSVRELVFGTRAVVEDGDAKRLSLTESQRFVRHSQALVHEVRSHAATARFSPDELTLLDSLDQQYQTFLVRKRPLCSRATTKLTATLYALQDRRPIPDRTPFISQADYSSSDSGTIDTTSANTKDCGRGGDHGGGGGGGRDCGSSSSHR